MSQNFSSNCKWNEIDLEFFKEIFNRFWNGEFEDKVLEVTNLVEYYSTGRKNSIYFGKKINVSDYPSWNKRTLDSLSTILNSNEFKSSYKLSTCTICDGILISPLAVQEHYDLAMWWWFDGNIPSSLASENVDNLAIPYWYYKGEDGKKYLPAGDIIKKFRCSGDLIKNSKKYVLVRTIPYDTWKKIMADYIDEGCSSIPQYWMNGDNYPKEDDLRVV